MMTLLPQIFVHITALIVSGRNTPRQSFYIILPHNREQSCWPGDSTSSLYFNNMLAQWEEDEEEVFGEVLDVQALGYLPHGCLLRYWILLL